VANIGVRARRRMIPGPRSGSAWLKEYKLRKDSRAWTGSQLLHVSTGKYGCLPLSTSAVWPGSEGRPVLDLWQPSASVGGSEQFREYCTVNSRAAWQWNEIPKGDDGRKSWKTDESPSLALGPEVRRLASSRRRRKKESIPVTLRQPGKDLGFRGVPCSLPNRPSRLRRGGPGAQSKKSHEGHPTQKVEGQSTKHPAVFGFQGNIFAQAGDHGPCTTRIVQGHSQFRGPKSAAGLGGIPIDRKGQLSTQQKKGKGQAGRGGGLGLSATNHLAQRRRADGLIKQAYRARPKGGTSGNPFHGDGRPRARKKGPATRPTPSTTFDTADMVVVSRSTRIY